MAPELGVRTDEGFGVLILPTANEVGEVGDSIGHRFIALSAFSCPANRKLGKKVT